MAGSFEIYKDTKGGYRFRLKAGNGEIILSGESYTEMAGVKNGVESVRKNAKEAGRFQVKKSVKGKAYFVLKAGNGQIIGQGETYSSDAACDDGINSVKKTAPGAELKILC
jgi:uncharacterized protein